MLFATSFEIGVGECRIYLLGLFNSGLNKMITCVLYCYLCVSYNVIYKLHNNDNNKVVL